MRSSFRFSSIAILSTSAALCSVASACMEVGRAIGVAFRVGIEAIVPRMPVDVPECGIAPFGVSRDSAQIRAIQQRRTKSMCCAVTCNGSPFASSLRLREASANKSKFRARHGVIMRRIYCIT